ncbi:ABC transporter ATP-binding protein [Roseicella sp. DB1501]|uniref:ABC transporter ATP-binding protein n=1 Tax=Roseicella sp. DB1501 TaxID=2730925 RepID=UPI001491342F|nr:ATP-binding cassette domain-containing protein [Roseicella sp. DB1501]NOG70309.1 ATP-binding cassette domain-containing protein [Roseicella sp. DB1501]
MDAIANNSRSLTEPDDSAPLIAARDLRFRVAGAAGEVNILRGLALTVRRGEALGLVGPSGSGKTSLLMLLAGLERPSGGALTVAGQDLARMDEDALARFRRSHVGIVFQAFHLIPTMTALENVAVPLEFAGRGDAFDRAAAALGAVGLGHRLGHYPGQLSGGEQQRVALARATVAEPPLLLADEPTGNLDRATGGQIIDLLFGLRERLGTTLLLITHDPALAARCSRVVRMEDGRIVEDAASRTSGTP